jgi:serine/threonine protein kinase
MARKPRSADVLGPYTLQSELGCGGNAVVWRAVGSDGEAAVKVLNRRYHDSEPYRRFRREVELLHLAATMSGVLPSLDSHRQNPERGACPPG